MVSLHKAIDRLFGVLARQNGSFYSKGWGDLEFWYSTERAKFDWTYAIQFGGSSLDIAESVRTASWPPSRLDLAWRPVKITPQYQILNTSFESPAPVPLYEALPTLSRTAYAQLVLPPTGFPTAHNMPCVLHLPGTGDHGFARRRELAIPLVHKGVASLFLEGPFHGLRRPAAQKGAKLFHVTDLLLQGRVTIEESRCLLQWMEEQGFGPMGICGMSMGGVHAAMVAALHPTSLATIPLLTPHSAEFPYCDGMLRHAVAFRQLAQALGGCEEDAKYTLRCILNRFTDITKFPKPMEPRAVMMVAALEDLYVDPDCAARLHAAWPGSVLRWVQGGHVSAFLQHHTRDQFRAAIVDALNMLSLTRGITNDLIEPEKLSFTNLYR